jgi:hypothetical protein
VDDESAEQTNQSSDTVLTTTTSQQPLEEGEKPNLQNVDYGKLNSKNSDDRRQELDNIADAAMEFQPTGYTLETTQV